MSYLYQNSCFDTVQRLHESVAADCPPVSNGYSLQCTPSALQVDIVATNLVDLTTYSSILYPAQIPCDVSMLDMTDFLWQITLILVAGFAIRAIIKAFQ